MQILSPDSEGIAQAVAALQAGLVVAHATETCYGLACDMRNSEAVRRVFAIKQRPETQPVSALFATLDQAKDYVEWNERAEELAREFLPGPLTLVLPLRAATPHFLYTKPNPNPNPTIGVRLSPHPAALALVTAFGTPVSTTSANVHGQENPYSAAQILAQYENCDLKPDLILDSGTIERRNPSRIIDLTGTSESILRS